jgi:hypothetical protein
MLTLVPFLEPFRGAVRPMSTTTPLPLGVVGLPVVAWLRIGDFFGGFF